VNSKLEQVLNEYNGIDLTKKIGNPGKHIRMIDYHSLDRCLRDVLFDYCLYIRNNPDVAPLVAFDEFFKQYK
jgi:hypothetical protein